MFSQMLKTERAARLVMGDFRESGDPLPPAPNYGPFGYFRLGMLVFAAMVAVLFLLMWF